ncbi:MAG: 30S ribosomal protein S8e [Candidatus Aenigmatarchaeota archaeon]
MPVWHGDRGKRKTGGAVTQSRKKRKFELGSNPLMTKLGPEKKKSERTKGGLTKLRALSTDNANVYNPADKTTKRVKITDIVENPANPHFVRRGIITKGATIETELGLARVRSRPSQHGVVSAVLLKEK